jgi:transcriptional regulator with XRE-family HTH domain
MEAKRRLPPSIPNRLRKHRRLRGLTQRQVAQLLGVRHANRISQWEKGLAMPDSLNLIKLAAIYRTYPNDLYFELYQEAKQELMNLEGRLFGYSQAGNV